MITVHHLNNSRSQRILWLLEELELPYEIVHYQRDPATMLAPPELRKIHPLGKSPVLDLDTLHGLMTLVADTVAYDTSHTGPTTTAEEALALGHGVCQDHAHVFLSAARLLGFPARYSSGYMMMLDRVDQDAGHAWAEAWVSGLGWVGFDAANRVCPDERYIQVATGLDYREAGPLTGVMYGGGRDSLSVTVQVQQ